MKTMFKLYKYKIQNLNMLLAHEHDENSLFHRDYLCHDLFKKNLESANIEYYLRDLYCVKKFMKKLIIFFILFFDRFIFSCG